MGDVGFTDGKDYRQNMELAESLEEMAPYSVDLAQRLLALEAMATPATPRLLVAVDDSRGSLIGGFSFYQPSFYVLIW